MPSPSRLRGTIPYAIPVRIDVPLKPAATSVADWRLETKSVLTATARSIVGPRPRIRLQKCHHSPSLNHHLEKKVRLSVCASEGEYDNRKMAAYGQDVRRHFFHTVLKTDLLLVLLFVSQWKTWQTLLQYSD